MHIRLIYSILFFLFITNIFSQENEELVIKKDSVAIKKKKPIKLNQGIDPLSPSKAAFYSAVLPGLGQIYNKKLWKAPIVWGAIGTGLYFFDKNDKDFKRFQTAYKLELAGREHEFTGLLDRAALERSQNVFKKNRDVSLFITIGLYALNILEANVDAHLPDKALDTNLSFSPAFFTESITNQPMFGVSMNFKF